MCDKTHRYEFLNAVDVMKKRKVAIISVASYPRIGGMTTWMDKIASSLSDEGFEVTFYALIEEYEEKIFQNKYEVKPVISSMQYPKLLGQYIPKLIRWLKLNLYFLFRDKSIKDCDIIISDMTPGVFSLASRLKNRYKKPLIVIVGGDMFYETQHQFYAKYLHQLLEKLYKGADAIIVDGYDHKENLVRRGVDNSKIKILGHGVDLNLYCANPDSKPFINYLKSNGIDITGKRVILFFGRLAKENGVDLIPDIVKGIPNSYSIIMGKGALYDELKKRIREEKLNVFLTGAIEKGLLISAIGLADVCLFPFRKIAGISQVITEAMACGEAIITTQAGAIDSLIIDGENGFICNVEDVEGLRNTLLKVLENKELKLNIGINARKTIGDDWNLENVKKEYTKIIDSLINCGVR